MIFQENTTVLWNREITPGIYRLALQSRHMAAEAAAGRFVMVRIDPAVFLRRPFSIHRLVAGKGPPEGIELLYKVVGPGTRRLSKYGAGQSLDVLGPVGRSFRVPEGVQKVLITAGGIGVAPLFFLAQTLIRQRRIAPGDIQSFIGAQNVREALCAEDFERLGIPTTVTTDDGSCGLQCLVTQPLAAAIAASRPDAIYACGPPAMLKCVADMAFDRHIFCQVSVETLMACGMGVCLGCAVERRDKAGSYLHACTDGPVFDASRIRL